MRRPNLLSGEVFPTEVRGRGAGFAASFAKLGAAAAAFLFPILLVEIGTQALLYGLVGTSLLGALVTWRWRIETAGLNLEQMATTGPQSSGAAATAVTEPGRVPGQPELAVARARSPV